VPVGGVLLPLQCLGSECLGVQQHLLLVLEPHVPAGEGRLGLLRLGGKLYPGWCRLPSDLGMESSPALWLY
jgi:hypothetical protein